MSSDKSNIKLRVIPKCSMFLSTLKKKLTGLDLTLLAIHFITKDLIGNWYDFI